MRPADSLKVLGQGHAVQAFTEQLLYWIVWQGSRFMPDDVIWNQLTLFVDGGISYSRPEKHTHLSYLILQEKLPPMDIRDQDDCHSYD